MCIRDSHLADVVVLASGGYGNVFFLSTNAMGSNVTATWRAHRKGAYFANPCYTQIPVSYTHLDVYKRQAQVFAAEVGQSVDDALDLLSPSPRHDEERVRGVDCLLYTSRCV